LELSRKMLEASAGGIRTLPISVTVRIRYATGSFSSFSLDTLHLSFFFRAEYGVMKPGLVVCERCRLQLFLLGTPLTCAKGGRCRLQTSREVNFLLHNPVMQIFCRLFQINIRLQTQIFRNQIRKTRSRSS